MDSHWIRRTSKGGDACIDLAGGPDSGQAYRLRDYARPFSRAQGLGLGRTVHAGEGRPPAEIREAIKHLHAQRIGHGTTLLDDPATVELVRERGVTLEACPTSNVHTGAVADFNANVHLPCVRAQIELSRGNAGKAAELLQSATPYDARNFALLQLRASALLAAGRPSEAMSEFEKIIERSRTVLSEQLRWLTWGSPGPPRAPGMPAGAARTTRTSSRSGRTPTPTSPSSPPRKRSTRGSSRLLKKT